MKILLNYAWLAGKENSSTSDSESSSSMPSPSSVLSGLKPSLLLPSMSPTLQFLSPWRPDLALAAMVPRPRLRHLLIMRQSATSSDSGTETAAAITTLECTSVAPPSSGTRPCCGAGAAGDTFGIVWVGAPGDSGD